GRTQSPAGGRREVHGPQHPGVHVFPDRYRDSLRYDRLTQYGRPRPEDSESTEPGADQPYFRFLFAWFRDKISGFPPVLLAAVFLSYSTLGRSRYVRRFTDQGRDLRLVSCFYPAFHP